MPQPSFQPLLQTMVLMGIAKVVGCEVGSEGWRVLRFSSSNLHVPNYCPRKPFFRPLRLRAWSVWTQCPRNLNWILLWLTLDAVCLRGLCGRSALPVSFHYLLDSSCGFLIPKTFGGRSWKKCALKPSPRSTQY